MLVFFVYYLVRSNPFGFKFAGATKSYMIVSELYERTSIIFGNFSCLVIASLRRLLSCRYVFFSQIGISFSLLLIVNANVHEVLWRPLFGVVVIHQLGIHIFSQRARNKVCTLWIGLQMFYMPA